MFGDSNHDIPCSLCLKEMLVEVVHFVWIEAQFEWSRHHLKPQGLLEDWSLQRDLQLEEVVVVVVAAFDFVEASEVIVTSFPLREVFHEVR